MKHIIGSAILSSFFLAGCMSDTGGATPTAATPLIGKQLVLDNGGSLVLNADGTVGGSLSGKPVQGTYSASATEVCSTYDAPDFLAGKEFCSTPEISGDSVVFKRRDGSSSPVYMIKG